MNKADFIKIGVLLLIVGFILEPLHFANNLFGGNNNDNQNGPKFEGAATVTVTVRNYDPLLIVPSTTDQKIIDEIHSDPSITNVRTAQNYIVFDIDSRDQVYRIANLLRSKNVSSLANAYVILPSNFYVTSGTQSLNVTAKNPIFNVQIEPLVDEGEEILVKIDAIVLGNQFVEFKTFELVSDEKTIEVNATISALKSSTFNFEVSWEKRTSVNMSGYKMKNTVLISPPLPQIEILKKKNISYVTYIDSNSIEVTQDFTDREKITSDFGAPNRTLSFLPSTYSITTNDTNSDPGNFTYSQYTYLVALPATIDGFSVLNPLAEITSTNKSDINSTIKLKLYIQTVGNKVVNYLVEK